MTRPSTRTKPFSQKDRDVVRRYERRFKKYLRNSELLNSLYQDPEVRKHAVLLEELLHRIYVFGMAVGAHTALDMVKR